jgi:plasmid maintenance system antidote protein VapI
MIKPSDQIRQAIAASELTRYRIAQLSGVPQSTLSKFVNGKGGLTLDTLDRLSAVMGLGVVVEAKATKATPRGKSRQKGGKRP